MHSLDEVSIAIINTCFTELIDEMRKPAEAHIDEMTEWKPNA